MTHAQQLEERDKRVWGPCNLWCFRFFFKIQAHKKTTLYFNETFVDPQKVSLNESLTNELIQKIRVHWHKASPALGPRWLPIIWTNGTCCVQREAGRPVLLVAWSCRSLS